MAFVCSRCKRDVETPGLFCPFCGAPAPQPDAEPDDPYVGRTIADKFFVNGILGRGGMGQVYKATHITLDRPVALKMLSKSFLSDASMVQRFHREARAASKLNHPNCINILDFGQLPDGALYIAMEYLPGRSLAKLLQDEFPLGEVRVVRIAGQILAALAEAHGAGIIHRDLKPANVMVETRRDEPDFVKVLDFGIAKLSEGGTAGQLTGTGIVCGTPGYMSPEQARGEELDARSDLYAVGVILYELLTGRLPFESETPMGFVAKHMTETPVPPSARRPDLRISPALEDLVMRTLAKSRDERPSSAEELRELLFTCELLPPDDAPQPEAQRGGGSTMVFRATPGPTAKPRTQPPSGVRAPNVRRFEPPQPTGAAPKLGTPPPAGPGTPKPGPGTPAPAPVAGTPRPKAGTPAPVPRTPAPAKRTPPPAIRRTPAPVNVDADAGTGDDDEEVEAETATPAPRRGAHARPAPRSGSRRNVVVAGVAAGVLLLALGAWAVLRSDPFAAPKPGPVAGARPESEPKLQKLSPDGAPGGTGPTLARPTPPPPPPPVENPVTKPAGADAAPAKPVVTVADPAPKPPPPVDAPPKAEPDDAKPAPVVARPEKTSPSRPRKGSGALQVIEGMNILKIPAPASGEGILTITASPWANAFLDDRELGETPREARVGAGSYKIRLEHPTFGRRETTITVPPGRRTVYGANLSN